MKYQQIFHADVKVKRTDLSRQTSNSKRSEIRSSPNLLKGASSDFAVFYFL